MLNLLWLIPALPFAGFLVQVLIGRGVSRRLIALLGVGAVGLSFVAAIVVALSFLAAPPAGGVYIQTLWTWIDVAGFSPQISFHLDALSLVMVLVVTLVSFLILLYSVDYMAGEERYGRFFAYMDLFVGMMLTLVLADNLLFLYFGWEGVGLCSFLLIGFWYRDVANARAARKAFIVTRVGDTALAIGLFLLFDNLGTLQIQELMQRAQQQWGIGSGLAIAAAALLLGGAVGKSAQVPLQIWLPDAMAGPTPVSALIHAATMVTAGVYLIARTHALFSLAPAVLLAVAIVGAVTLLLAGFSAMAQRDLKRALAYSTISQVGYMFLALGVGAWSAAIFHLVTHAFFKALLFLAAGVVIIRLHEERDMFKMGGLRQSMPLAFWTFLIGAASLSALPLITAGFYSKDLILWRAFSSSAGSPWLWAAGLVGALLTSIYAFRMVFLTFYGPPSPLLKSAAPERPGPLIGVPLIVLSVLAIIAGFVEIPGGPPLFSRFLESVLPLPDSVRGSTAAEVGLAVAAAVVSLLGIYTAWVIFVRRPASAERLARTRTAAGLRHLWAIGWGFDWFDYRFIVRPFVWLARAGRADPVDRFYQGIARLATAANRLLSRTESGRVRWYAAGIGFGAIVLVGLAVFLAIR